MIWLGAGLAVMTTEKIEAVVAELIKKGQLSEKEGKELAAQSQRQGDGVIRHFFRAVVGHIADGNAVFPRGIDIHGIEAHAVADDDTASFQPGNSGAGDGRVVPDDQGLRLQH